MKIAVISTTVLPSNPWLPRGEGPAFQGYGGLEPIVGELAQGFARKGHEVTLVGCAGTQVPGCRNLTVARGTSEEAAFRGYRQHLRDQDHVVSHDGAKWPVVEFMENGAGARSLQVCHHWILNRGQMSPPPIQANWTTFSLAQTSMVEMALGIQTRHAHHGIPLELYPAGDSEKRNDYYLILSRLSPEKGVVPAVRMLRENGRRVVVIADDKLIADRGYAREFYKLVDGKQVAFVPGTEIDHETKLWYLRQARALVHTPLSPWTEIFGISVCEALACGTPVLATKNGAIPEQVRHGKEGFLADTVEGLAPYLDRVDKIDRAKCRKRVESNFTVDHMVSRHLSLIQDIREGRGW